MGDQVVHRCGHAAVTEGWDLRPRSWAARAREARKQLCPRCASEARRHREALDIIHGHRPARDPAEKRAGSGRYRWM